jgi:Skp family chaperone for outer membrane proteins
MRGLGLALCLALGVTLAPARPVLAEDAPSVLDAMGVVVLDERRLFSDSRFGRRVLSETQAAVDALIAENKGIEAELEREERALADQREGMEPQAFRALADAFDARVTAQRRERAEREQAITARVQEEERRFQSFANTVLAEMAQEAGLVAVLSSQGLIFHRPQIDITDDLIARIDARYGDGSN